MRKALLVVIARFCWAWVRKPEHYGIAASSRRSVRYRTGNEIVARVAGRIARGIRQRDIREDVLRNRALPRCRYHAARKQGPISIGRDAERIVHLNRETLAGLRGEGLGKIAAAF